MFAAGLAHGLYPALTATDSLRSLLGSVAPFAFGFARLPPGWGRAMVRSTAWIPLVSAAGGAALAIGGLHPMFIEAGGQRLAGLGHPAYLAGVCLAAIYACLVELYRDGHRRWMLLLGANFAILLATGARAPLACGVAVTGLTLLFVESDMFPRRRRIGLLLVSGCVLPVLAVLAPDLPSVRLFNVLTEAAADFSGRDLLWPAFARAADASPLLGWGVGAGNAIIPPDSDVARIVQSWAAHNEYLRILVEGGQLGRALLVSMLSCWVVWRSRALASSDKAILRLAFAAFAVHAYTDNVLIATTACVFFAFATGVFARTPAALRRTPAMA
jgi:O-antigen ligase